MAAQINLKEIAREAARQATDRVSDSNTFEKNYKPLVANMIESSILSALEQLSNAANAREMLMSERIKSLENEIRTLKLNKTTVGPSFSAILKGNTPELAKQRNQLIQVVTADNRARKEKESNVIVIGLAPSTTENDKESISRFFEAAGLSVNVNHVHRIKSSKNNQVSNSNVLRVSLQTPSDKASVIQACTHHNVIEYRGVFAREDRTPAEQTKFNEDRAILKKKNDELSGMGLLDRPFRNVIHRRTGGICCIDVLQSNAQKRYVYASAQAAISAAKQSSLPVAITTNNITITPTTAEENQA
jgi:hypothetical protein